MKSMELQGEDLAGEGAEEAAAIVSIVGNHGHAGQAADKVTCSELRLIWGDNTRALLLRDTIFY